MYLLLSVGCGGGALWLSRHFHAAWLAGTAVALLSGIPAAYQSWRAIHREPEVAAPDLGPWAEALANAVGVSETAQRTQLIGEGAHRIDLTYRYLPGGDDAEGASSTGCLTGIVDYYRALRPARLVITGPAGAGKTMLALELLLGLLHDAQEGQPVPLRASLSSWDTSTPFEVWLANRVHDHLRPRGANLAYARGLVAERRILPVLDGLDETDADTTVDRRPRAVRILQALNIYQDKAGSAPLILTCRTAEYAQLGVLDHRMRRAAHIALDSVTTEQAGEYLTARGANLARWRPVLETFRQPDHLPRHPLASALAVPWRLNLAATAYEERHGRTHNYLRDPARLLGLATPHQVRDHLLALHVSAVTHRHPIRPDRYQPADVHHWLAALAAMPSATSSSVPSTDLVPHRLWPLAGARLVRVVDATLAALVTLIFGVVLLAQTPMEISLRLLLGTAGFTTVAVLVILRAMSAHVAPPILARLRRPGARTPARRRRLARNIAVALVGGFAGGIAIAPTGGLTYGIGTALAYGLAAGLAVSLYRPSHAFDWNEQPLLVDPRRPVHEDLVIGLVAGLLAGLATGLTIGLTHGIVGGLAGGITAGLSGALAYGLAAGLAYGLAAGLGTGLAVSLVTGLSTGLSVGLAGGVVGGLYMFTGAGRRYVVFVCCARSRGMLPLRLGLFLNWAYTGGLLRISGIAYQFRHRELQEWLLTNPEPQD
ncbi:NACHT domain-containing protein [Streptomyces fuscichromogenes]|uniref:NACHT domain-containing protein n=1 Tax=Streptomyces fuscichromogenes TaxID=1324013 RepID=UPI00166FB05F|nr:NACHT domain-containing protein [Streptomyces fuscichromogenes]